MKWDLVTFMPVWKREKPSVIRFRNEDDEKGALDGWSFFSPLYIICVADCYEFFYSFHKEEAMSQSETISLRMSPEQREVITSAADFCGVSRTAFIVESAVGRAQDVLLDRTRLVLDENQWDAFMKILDGPVDSSAMRRTLATPPPWKE